MVAEIHRLPSDRQRRRPRPRPLLLRRLVHRLKVRRHRRQKLRRLSSRGRIVRGSRRVVVGRAVGAGREAAILLSG